MSEDAIKQMADILFDAIAKDSDDDGYEGPWIGDRKNAGTQQDYVGIDGNLDLREVARNILEDPRFRLKIKELTSE